MTHGHVRTFFLDKGYGFITDDDTGTSFFFHVTEFLRAGAEGDERKPKLGELVTFDVSPAVTFGKKSQAIQIRPCLPPPKRTEPMAGLSALAKNSVSDLREHLAEDLAGLVESLD
jgi:cold shock CspA family protein